MTIYFITGNEMKFREAKAIIPELEQVDIELTEVQGLDSHVIARAKIEEARKQGLENFLIEDTGLYFEALNGYPGPLIKWMLDALKSQGIYDLISHYSNRNAIATSHIAYFDGELHFFDGTLQGIIVPKRGIDHGWSAIFQPKGSLKTYGEMTVGEKNAISHRSKSFGALKAYLDSKK